MDKKDFSFDDYPMTLEAQLCRKAYCNNMRMRYGKKDYGRCVIPCFDGGVAADGRKYSCLWERVAKKLKSRKFDVANYAEYAFDENKDISSPTMFMSDKILEKYQLYINAQKPPKIWELEDEKIITEISIKKYIFKDNPRVLEMVLLSDNIDVSPLSRYVFGCRNNSEDMVKDLKDAAFKQFMKRRFFYERFYADRVPKEFLEKVK